MDPDFEELSNDVDLITRMRHFGDASKKIEDILQYSANNDFYEKLSNSDKIKCNLLMSFGLNSLFWMYLKAEGIDPVTHEIKSENDRLKKTMARAQEIKDKKMKMPKLDKAAVKRFVRSGLWKPNNTIEFCEDNAAEGIISENFENWDHEDESELSPSN